MALGGSRASGLTAPTATGTSASTTETRSIPRPSERSGLPGYVSDLGEWGPIVNSGAWLTVDGIAIDVLFRDLGVVERWLDDAERGRFEVLLQNGYIVGAPTYVPVGELAINKPLSGELPRPEYPEPLAAAAVERWRGRASVSLMFARMHAGAADRVCCAGMLAGAVLCEAHARLAARGEWVLNEKRLVERAGLDEVQPLLGEPGAEAVDAVAAALRVEPLSAR